MSQTAFSGAAGPLKVFGSVVVTVTSRSGPMAELTGPDATRVTVPAGRFRHVPAAEWNGLSAGPVPANEQPSPSRSTQFAWVASVVKSRV